MDSEPMASAVFAVAEAGLVVICGVDLSLEWLAAVAVVVAAAAVAVAEVARAAELAQA